MLPILNVDFNVVAPPTLNVVLMSAKVPMLKLVLITDVVPILNELEVTKLPVRKFTSPGEESNVAPG